MFAGYFDLRQQLMRNCHSEGGCPSFLENRGAVEAHFEQSIGVCTELQELQMH